MKEKLSRHCNKMNVERKTAHGGARRILERYQTPSLCVHRHRGQRGDEQPAATRATRARASASHRSEKVKVKTFLLLARSSKSEHKTIQKHFNKMNLMLLSLFY